LIKIEINGKKMMKNEKEKEGVGEENKVKLHQSYILIAFPPMTQQRKRLFPSCSIN